MHIFVCMIQLFLVFPGVGTWDESIQCSERNTTRSLLISHRIKPCCVGLKGQCRMVVEEHCDFLGGTYYDNGPENCRHVSVAV